MNPARADTGVRVVAALVFAASAALTIAWCGSMSAMPGMEMPGGWTMSMTWMRMPGQGWLDLAGMFCGMWAVMMIAMMMPVFAPELIRFRRGLAREEACGFAILAFAASYFGVWIAAGIATFPLGLAFAELAMRSEEVSRITPVLAGIVVMLAGIAQFSGWKLRQIARCRHSADCCASSTNYLEAGRAGARLGRNCFCCCAGFTAALLVIGVMDLLAMALVTIAISAERLMTARIRAARLVGLALLAVGAVMLFRAAV